MLRGSSRVNCSGPEIVTTLSEKKSKGASAAVYNSVREDILFGRLAPGGKLKLADLRDRYTAGTNTLREVLTRLATEGFVEATDQKGFRVVETSREHFAELARFRILLEADAIRRSIQKGDLEWEGRVVAALHKLIQVEERITKWQEDLFVDWSAYDYGFHHALMSACGSALHLRTHRAVFDQIRRYVLIEYNTHGFRGQELVDEHQAIGQAALDRDAARCVDLLTEHLNFYIHKSRSGGCWNEKSSE